MLYHARAGLQQQLHHPRVLLPQSQDEGRDLEPAALVRVCLEAKEKLRDVSIAQPGGNVERVLALSVLGGATEALGLAAGIPSRVVVDDVSV